MNAKQAFQLLGEAYQILSNTEKRRWYDFKTRYPSSTTLRSAAKPRTSNYESYYKAYTHASARQTKSESWFDKWMTRKAVDRILFYFLIVAGVFCIIYGVYQLFFSKWEGTKSLSGIIFGVWFVFWMFYGWNLMKKK